MRTETTDTKPGPRAPDGVLVRRPWTAAERRVVLRGLYGRLVIAIEPVICGSVFGAIALGFIFLNLPASARLPHREAAIVLSPIFGLVSLAFCAYAIILLVPPVRALIHTFSPIYIVDGYVRYRKPDRDTEADSNGYLAVLTEDRQTLAEWPSIGKHPVVDATLPALVEFSYYGGIHRIDGRSTGVLPESMNAFGVGKNAPRL
jgi:hypothetical protein